MPPRFLPDPRRWRWWLLLLLCGTLPGARLAAVADDGSRPGGGEGEPFVQFWSPREFRGTTECVCLAQDARGVMFIGNRGLILEYDGSAWRHIPMENPAFIPGMAYDARTDTVFVGAQDDLGYLKADAGGGHAFVSLRGELPAEAREVGSFYGVYATPEGVFFVGGGGRVLRWREGRFTAWRLAASGVLGSHWAGGRLYVCRPEIGLLRLEGEGFVPVSEDPLFRRVRVSALLAEADGSLLVGTDREGMFSLREGVVRPLACEGDAVLREHGIAKVLRLRDGSLAVATRRGELLLLDAARRFRSRVDRFGGRGGGEIYRLFEDAEGGLWVGLQTGVARVEPDSPFSVYRAGPEDDVSSTYAATRWFDSLVVGNNDGLFRLVPADPAAAVGAHLEAVPGTRKASFGLGTVADGALAITEGRVTLLAAGGKPVPVAAGEITGALDLVVSRAAPGRVYVVDQGGRIHRLRRDEAAGGWLHDGIAAECRKPNNCSAGRSGSR